MTKKLKFIDLFAGIGGFHLALSSLNMECVFASEIDEVARDVYKKNHGIADNLFNDDIRNLDPGHVPDHDILCAGFPCQPFSQAGFKRGFNDFHNSERGNLFFYILEIIKEKRPNVIFLENVRHLVRHDNGETFKIIREKLIELNYSFNYKVIKACDFGVPQHRPRVYIVCFNMDVVDTESGDEFTFPKAIPLTMSMSDIFNGKCNKNIGYTLRVGGKGSPINDRRNWDGYIVDNHEVRLGPNEGKLMMGLPLSFKLPDNKNQAMKLLGNSVCINVIYCIAKQIQEYMKNNLKHEKPKENYSMLNSGEWGEFYAFLKIIKDKVVYFGDKSKNKLDDHVIFFKLMHNNKEYQYIINNDLILVKDKNNQELESHVITEILPDKLINSIKNQLIKKSGTFKLSDDSLRKKLLITNFKGTSYNKGDINLSFIHGKQRYYDEQLGIKSFLSSLPTLLNAGKTTNFIFKVNNFNGDINSINKIDSKSKIRDRLKSIYDSGGFLKFIRCENKVFQENLNIVDGDMINIVPDMLLRYYRGESSKISDLITNNSHVIKITRLLYSILLGMFSSIPWDGKISSNGIITVEKNGELLIYHNIKQNILNEYLFNNTKLDTPSSSRHSFGFLYQENRSFYFKLNLQIRNI